MNRRRFVWAGAAPGTRNAWVGLAVFVGAVLASNADSGIVQVNRNVPPVEPPQPGLHFSSQPTPQEFFRTHIFQEPLVPVGPEPTAAENSALAAALEGYSKRSGPDDFSALTGFLQQYPDSPWAAALLTDLGLEYYNTAHYSLAIDAWSNAWSLAGKARDAKAVALVQRAFGELLRMNSRLGRMDELERLLSCTGNQPLPGQAAQRVVDAREALWDMKHRPQIAFRCGPMALRSIRIALGLPGSSDAEIFKSASTQRGCSLPQVAELSRKIGLNYQMAFRDTGDFVVPCVVHWKVGHYAAIVRKIGDLYELQDPTFGNSTWASKEALEAETSGYFLIGPGPLPPGWRAVNEPEGAKIWGKGETLASSNQNCAKNDFATGGSCPATGMATAKVHLMEVNLHLGDNPLGYTPPVGPNVKFALDYNLRDVFQPANFNYGNLGAQWTSDWFTYITDNPANLVADVNLYVAGGGQRTYTAFDANTQSYAFQQYDWNLLTRTSTNPIRYQLLSGDGSKMIFGQSDGSSGSSRNIFLTQEIDPQGNALTFTYDGNLCLVSVQDAIGQVTSLTYGLASTNIGTPQNPIIVQGDPYKLTSVTDPFGRTATLNYEPQPVLISQVYSNNQLVSSVTNYTWGLASDTDVIGITSQFGYQAVSTSVVTNGNMVTNSLINFVNSLTTPYGTTSFIGVDNAISLSGGNTRTMDIVYPDASRERIEYYQAYVFDTNLLQFQSDSPLTVPTGMKTANEMLLERDSYYWDRNASALALGDFSKARQYHFCHTESGAATSGALESMKPPLEGRIWFDYAGQNENASLLIGSNTLPLHIGRVLDDGTTQLHTYGYNGFGHVTNSIDPLGRTLTYIYDTNGIDLLEVRQTRLGNNELLAKLTYNSQHRPLTATDAAGQTTTFTYNARGQVLTVTNPRNETMTLGYDANGFLLALDGPLPGPIDENLLTYDAYGRVRTATTVSGDTITADYDNLDRVTRVTFPDGTFAESTYDILSLVMQRDRAGRLTLFEHDNMRQVTKVTDPLGQVTRFDWCRCGSLKSLIDPMGRMTFWTMDVQGRKVAKQFPGGTQIRYFYENRSSRLRQVIDEKQQMTFFAYNTDDTLKSITYGDAAIATPPVSFVYDPNYQRALGMTDGTGTTTYSYLPITVPPILGAGSLASVVGPLTNDVITYAYDELGRPVQSSVDGLSTLDVYDAAGRVVTKTNALGSFSFTYDGGSARPLSKSFPNGQTTSFAYGNGVQNRRLQQITHTAGAVPVSQFSYVRDIPARRITSWSQQADAQTPSVFSFNYDAANQLLSALVTNAGTLVNIFGYTYDRAANRLVEQVGSSTNATTYNGLNEISTSTAPGPSRTNEWDAAHRLTAVNVGNQRTEFTYDGLSRLVAIRRLVNGSGVSHRRFVWCGGQICEERDASGANVTKRFFAQGMKLETGPTPGVYYYTRDHLGSIREVTDAGGVVRARYTYDPFGRRSKVSGDVDADFGFAGMFYSAEASLAFARFRVYDPELGRWLSRDPLGNAELAQGPNLYAYVGNEPISRTDPSGLLNGEKVLEYTGAAVTGAAIAAWAGPALTTVDATCKQQPLVCAQAGLLALAGGGAATLNSPAITDAVEDFECAVTTEMRLPPAVPERGSIEGYYLNMKNVSTEIEEGDIPPEPVVDIDAGVAEFKAQYEQKAPNFLTQEQEEDLAKSAYSPEQNLPGRQVQNIAAWDQDKIVLDRMFFRLAEAYQRQNGGSFDAAWEAIARLTGRNPEHWH